MLPAFRQVETTHIARR